MSKLQTVIALALVIAFVGPVSADNLRGRTVVSIRGEKFSINGRPTYEGRTWNGAKIEGLLLNSRMVQGIFDDWNPGTAALWAYHEAASCAGNRPGINGPRYGWVTTDSTFDRGQRWGAGGKPAARGNRPWPPTLPPVRCLREGTTMPEIALSADAVAKLRFRVKGWHFPVREKDREG